MQRIAKWDNLKFILILFVVVGHFVDVNYADNAAMRGIFLFIYSFHMPLFIFVSGLFSKKIVNSDRLDSAKILPYFVLAIALKFVLYFLRLMLNWEPTFSLLTEGGLPWYLIALGMWIIITHFVRNISPKYILITSFFIGLAAGLDSSIGAYLCLSRILVFYPFFLLGYYADSNRILAFTSKKSVKFASVIVLALTVAAAVAFSDGPYTLRPILTGQHPYAKLGEFKDYGILIRAAVYAASTLIGMAVISLTPDKPCFFTKLGSRTVQVYALHYILLMLITYFNFTRWLLTIGVPHRLAYTVYILLAVAVTFFLSLPIFEKPLRLIFRPKKRIN